MAAWLIAEKTTFCNNMLMVKLSIIVPVYNCEKFLEKCVKSIQSQTVSGIEILLVNDGSTDSSLSICRSFALEDLRIRVFNQQNSGQSRARNVGLENANGEYIAFVDSDDWVDSDYFEKLISACDKHEADVACGSIIRERKYSNKFRINYTSENIYVSPQEKIDAAKVPDMCYVWNKVYRRSFLDFIELKFIDGMYFEDVDFVTRAIYYSNKIVTVPGTYYHYWTNGNSTVKTMRKSDKKRYDSLLSKKYVLEFFRQHNLTSGARNLIRKKNCVKIFGLTILKSYEWETKKVYYLFGVIPILEKITYA